MKNFFTALVAAILLSVSSAEAETQTYEGTGVFTITQGETQNVAKKRAKLEAERDALEQIYLYVKAQSSSKNSRLTKDEIVTVAAGLMNVLKTKFAVTKEDGFFVVTATVIAEIDPDEIPEAVEREKNRRLHNN